MNVTETLIAAQDYADEALNIVGESAASNATCVCVSADVLAGCAMARTTSPNPRAFGNNLAWNIIGARWVSTRTIQRRLQSINP